MNSIKDAVLKRVLAKDKWGEDDKSLERFHPSSAGYCERQIFLSKIKVKIFTDSVRGAMQSGTNIHNWIQSFDEVKENYEIEKNVKTDVPDSPIYFLGKADLVAKDKSFVGDIKSINGLFRVQSIPMKEHIYQIIIYMKGLDINKGKIIYVNKADLKVLEHEVEESPIRLKKAFDKVKVVYEALKVWDNQVKWDKIPFEKCGCFFCRNEWLDPQFEKLLKGESNE